MPFRHERGRNVQTRRLANEMVVGRGERGEVIGQILAGSDDLRGAATAKLGRKNGRITDFENPKPTDQADADFESARPVHAAKRPVLCEPRFHLCRQRLEESPFVGQPEGLSQCDEMLMARSLPYRLCAAPSDPHIRVETIRRPGAARDRIAMPIRRAADRDRQMFEKENLSRRDAAGRLHDRARFFGEPRREVVPVVSAEKRRAIAPPFAPIARSILPPGELATDTLALRAHSLHDAIAKLSRLHRAEPPPIPLKAGHQGRVKSAGTSMGRRS